jgi:hypothetical protein
MGLYTGLANPITTASAASLKADLDGNAIIPGTIVVVQSISATAPMRGSFRFVAAANDADNNQSQLIIAPTTNPAAGRWVRNDPFIDLILPIAAATADNANLLTVPANVFLKPLPPPHMYYEMTVAWGGGVGAAMGISFTNPAIARTKGSLMGGALGDGSFTIASEFRGNLGIVWGATPGIFGLEVVLTPTSTINYDRISGTPFFATGAGNVHAPCFLMPPIQTPQVPP